MTKHQRIEALEIASQYDIKATSSWWNPFENVQWKVLGSKKILSGEQYYYLSRNKFLKEKEVIKENEVVILTISAKGIEKINELKPSTPAASTSTMPEADEWKIGDKFTTPETGDKVFVVDTVMKHDVEANDARSRAGFTIFSKGYITKVPPTTIESKEGYPKDVPPNGEINLDNTPFNNWFDGLDKSNLQPDIIWNHWQRYYIMPLRFNNEKIKKERDSLLSVLEEIILWMKIKDGRAEWKGSEQQVTEFKALLSTLKK